MVLPFLSAFGVEPIAIPLWPDGAPTSNGLEQTEEHTSKDLRISKVSAPVMYVYPAAKPNGMMIIACPGGGYGRLAWDHEGIDMTPWMNSMGITYAVLKYRMPNGHKEVPLEDGQRAIELARRHAADWGVNPSKIGIMGSSAGGHFAATAATLYGDPKYRPDFQILLYPVISMDSVTHRGSRDNLLGPTPTAQEIDRYSLERRVDANTPPAFIALSADDRTVPPRNGIGYAEALIEKGVPVTLHVYPIGGHGWGFRDSFIYKRQWTGELEKWLESLKNN